jgi:hypothetical protein
VFGLLLDLGDALPELVEHLVEDRDLLQARGEHGPQGGVDVLAVADVDAFERAQGIDRLGRGREQLATSQLAPEADDVTLEVGVAGAAL